MPGGEHVEASIWPIHYSCPWQRGQSAFFPVKPWEPRACQKLGNCPGQCKTCKFPTPGTDKAGKCPVVARRGGGLGAGGITIIRWNYSVSHPHLISKLDQIGIKGPLLQWFTSYLDNGVQRVVIDGKNSECLPVTSGVPQGSLLGPALFVLFINDMPCAVSQRSTLALFADDAKCFCTLRSASNCVVLFQGDIDKTWLTGVMFGRWLLTWINAPFAR